MDNSEKTKEWLKSAIFNYNDIGLGRTIVHKTDLRDALSVIESQQAEIERLKSKEILELLKKHQPMIAKGINGTFGSGIGYCPSCGNGMHYANYPGQLTQHYCDQCGQSVKWSD